MAYFNHAFNKVFVGVGNSNDGATGFIGAGIPTLDLADATTHGPGSWGLFDDTYTSVNNASAAVTGGKLLMLAAASIYTNDKIGPYHGGYKESNKSKWINPKLVSAFWRVDPCDPQAETLHVGNTNYTSVMSPSNAACCFEFLCGETYYLRLDIKGSPALRFLDRNMYQTLDAYTGCCSADDPAPAIVDSTLVMITWANAIINNPYMSQYLSVIVFDENGNPLYAPGTPSLPTWDNYISPGHGDGLCAGLRIQGAYVDTRFGDCSFQPSDFFEKEPIKILGSMVDYTGDPCTFEGICVVEECPARQGAGFGETVLRELILSERYLQNFFATDFRIREITQGDQLLSIINRTASYYRYYVKHNIPRNSNPTGVYDNDQYTLEVITTVTVPAFETIMVTWLSACGCSQVELETFDCNSCTTLVP